MKVGIKIKTIILTQDSYLFEPVRTKNHNSIKSTTEMWSFNFISNFIPKIDGPSELNIIFIETNWDLGIYLDIRTVRYI